ncbi:hypothetical protein [Patulibacter defluvii]|uniref:hypothetical protein n=1 Tax=Patulibacter defluvii TaxID=3095358 RepID=UPI002A74F113|nr:hypothetical protein [Patulibacter sp. DM4]
MSPGRGRAALLAAALTGAVAVAVSGCGGDDPSPSTTTGATATTTAAAPAASAYARDAASACRTIVTESRDLPRLQRERELTVDQLEQVAERQGRAFRDRIAALTPPGDRADAHRRLVALLARQADPATRARDMAGLARAQRTAATAFDAAGLTACAGLWRDGARQTERLAARGPQVSRGTVDPAG